MIDLEKLELFDSYLVEIHPVPEQKFGNIIIAGTTQEKHPNTGTILKHPKVFSEQVLVENSEIIEKLKNKTNIVFNTKAGYEYLEHNEPDRGKWILVPIRYILAAYWWGIYYG